MEGILTNPNKVAVTIAFIKVKGLQRGRTVEFNADALAQNMVPDIINRTRGWYLRAFTTARLWVPFLVSRAVELLETRLASTSIIVPEIPIDTTLGITALTLTGFIVPELVARASLNFAWVALTSLIVPLVVWFTFLNELALTLAGQPIISLIILTDFDFAGNTFANVFVPPVARSALLKENTLAAAFPGIPSLDICFAKIL